MVLSSVVAGLAATSCMHDPGEDPTLSGRVSFVVSTPRSDAAAPAAAPASRAITEGSTHDSHIGELAVVLFDDEGIFERLIGVGGGGGEPAIDRVSGDSGRWRFEIDDLADGTYNALFIANSRDELEEFTGANPAATIADFRSGFAVSRTLGAASPWNASPGSGGYRAFPMSSREVTFTVPNSTDYAKTPVELMRALTKINLIVDPSVTNFTLTGVSVHNFASGGRMIPAAAWRSGSGLFNAAELNPAGSVAYGTGMVRGEDDGMDFSAAIDGVNNRLVDEIFVYEQAAFDPATMTITDWGADNLCLLVRGDVTIDGVEIEDALYRVDLLHPVSKGGELRHVNILRNYCYEVTITSVTTMGDAGAYTAPPAGFEFEIDAWDATNGQRGMLSNTVDGKNQLTVSRTTVVFGPSAGSQTLTVYTDHSEGWNEVSGMGAGSAPFSMPTVSGGSKVTVEVPIEVTANATAQIRHRQIVLRAGGIVKTIELVQLPALGAVLGSGDYAASTTVTPYAGAFWRADQTGERLIGLQPDTTWSAFAMEGGEWVVMDAKPSLDRGVRTGGMVVDARASDFDRNHAVESTVGWATGSTGPDGGYFRLGARNQYGPTPDAPVRYAVVLVVPGGVDNPSTSTADYRLLFLRQGHAADYLMRPTDGSGDATLASRPLARRFSPYNLTASGFNGSGNTAHYYNVREWGDPTHNSAAAFTDYPSQAGALFRWAHPEGVRAYNPVVPGDGAPDDWETIDNSEASPVPVWDGLDPYYPDTGDGRTLRDNYEGCPPGWRRPADGNTWTKLAEVLPEDSEMLQSLLWRPGDTAENNGVAGLYADGYYDRLDHSNPGDAVNSDRSTVAYGGKVIYNPLSGASLFFPFTGGRVREGGPNHFAGDAAFYWSSSSWEDGFDDRGAVHFRQSVAMLMDRHEYGHANRNNTTIGTANPVRCVAAPDPAPIQNLAHAAPGVIGIRHSDLEALQSGRKTPDDPSIRLTLRGSGTYRGTWVERNVSGSPEFASVGGPESEPVYTVYFKWGSTVAVIGGANGTPFGNDRVVWVNPGFEGDINGWGDIPYTVGTGAGGYNLPDSSDPTARADGRGDPCDYVGGALADASSSASGWRMPDGGPWTYHNDAGSYTPFGAGMDDLWTSSPAITARWRTGTFNGVAVSGAVTPDGHLWLPAAGHLTTNGEFRGFNTDGDYWSASVANGDSAYAVGFNAGYVSGSGIVQFHYALPVRCVRRIMVE